MLSADAIKEIEKLARYEVKDISGIPFHVGASGAAALKFPTPAMLTCFGLTQLLNFIKARGVSGAYINVLSHDRVQLIQSSLGDNEEIVVLANADFSKVYKSFPFEEQLSQENFIIELMTKFEQDEVRDRLIKVVSQVRAEKIRSSDDDGFSQVASVKAGAVLVKEEKVQNLWELVTFKTFPEVEQPPIPYVLRLHQRNDEVPKFALYDCDGGAWRVKTTSVIRDYCNKWLAQEKLVDRVQVL